MISRIGGGTGSDYTCRGHELSSTCKSKPRGLKFVRLCVYLCTACSMQKFELGIERLAKHQTDIENYILDQSPGAVCEAAFPMSTSTTCLVKHVNRFARHCCFGRNSFCMLATGELLENECYFRLPQSVRACNCLAQPPQTFAGTFRYQIHPRSNQTPKKRHGKGA